MAEQAKCRGCGADIRFFDLGTSKDGKKKWAVCDQKPLKVWVAVGNRMIVTEAYQDHHAVCPNAQDFRKPKEQPPEQAYTEDNVPF